MLIIILSIDISWKVFAQTLLTDGNLVGIICLWALIQRTPDSSRPGSHFNEQNI